MLSMVPAALEPRIVRSCVDFASSNATEGTPHGVKARPKLVLACRQSNTGATGTNLTPTRKWPVLGGGPFRWSTIPDVRVDRV